MTRASLGQIQWEHWRVFLAVVREGSLSGAARALDSSPATVGRSIEALEAALTRSMFTRSPSGLQATSDALALVPLAQAMGAAALALEREASSGADEVSGAVRITASEMVGAEILPPVLVGLRERYPQLAIELALNNRTEDLLRRDADIAVRMFEPTQGALIAQRLGRVEIGLYAHRTYVERHGLPRDLTELAQGHTLIGFDRDPFITQQVGKSGVAVRREMFALRTDNDLAQLAALRAGFGIGGCQRIVAARDANLVAVLADDLPMHLDAWLVMHSDQRQVARVRAAFAFLAVHLRELIGASARPGPGRLAVA